MIVQRQLSHIIEWKIRIFSSPKRTLFHVSRRWSNWHVYILKLGERSLSDKTLVLYRHISKIPKKSQTWNSDGIERKKHTITFLELG